MHKINDLPILSEKPAAATGMSRREAARCLLVTMAAGTFPWAASTHPIWEHLKDEHLMKHADAFPADSKLHFLDTKQFASLVAMAEVLVPGSTKANVANFVDLLLSIESEKNRKEFHNSLATLEAESKTEFAKPFVELTRSERNTIFTAVSSSSQSDSNAIHSSFLNLREWVTGAYYSSEIGMRELGWTPDRVFAEFPGCSHPEGHD